MELQGFNKFQEILHHNHRPPSIGFAENVSTGDINRFASRIRVAKNFRGINLDGYAENTVYGYDGFFQVFLTHSALEVFMEIMSIKNLGLLEAKIEQYNPEQVIQLFIEKDPKNLLYEFLYQRLTSNKLKDNLNKCHTGSSNNVAYISASIRHIFAHGYLCAYSGGIKPRQVHTICTSISEFLLCFMDLEFAKKIESYYQNIFG
ncbi:hypothetical protein [Mastigocoleus testarum]|uniref:Uncharacterized protein n=1 Tax=Mastigocoleus testarum BC008 TaxID=371196 RepID=A0A0V7ZF13_9CYAN|nr:hypothetical protein [Mastigocoleus testarum]KST63172.1 hypothetical protein BC008_12775 [Mastigocoleus testarum BC008]KST63184.1 hypothetical protein BC008_12820 [Mastigocoleus testarum BC008]